MRFAEVSPGIFTHPCHLMRHIKNESNFVTQDTKRHRSPERYWLGDPQRSRSSPLLRRTTSVSLLQRDFHVKNHALGYRRDATGIRIAVDLVVKTSSRVSLALSSSYKVGTVARIS